MKKLISFFCITILLFTILCPVVSAVTMDSFTHKDQPSGATIPVNSRETYFAVKTITSSSLGMEKSLEGLTDICDSQDGSIYVLCGDKSSVFILNSDYSFKNELVIKNKDNEILDFTGAKGIFVDENNTIYIADTSNARVVIADSNGIVKDIWELPESNLIPDDLIYQPISVVVDASGYIYVLSSGCYYGALSYDANGKFIGFYGASTVQSGALDTLSFLWDKLTSNDVKREQSIKTIPYSFVDFAVDNDGYMITCTGNTDNQSNGTGQIRKISPDGSNILFNRDSFGHSSTSSALNFLENKLVFRLSNGNLYSPQNVVSVDVDSNGFIYALDMVTGWIYLYDNECNLINTFGGGFSSGEQQGIFRMPVSLAVHGSSILVADSSNCNITVFDRTNYGNDFLKAQSMYLKGNYEESKVLWQKVLSQDRGNQLAYKGMAMISFLEGDYNTALKYAENGLDYTVYDMAWQKIISDFIGNNFAWLVLIVLVLIIGIIALCIFLKKRSLMKINNPKLKLLASVSFHPFNSFNDIKYKKQGSILYANILLFLLFVAMSLKDLVSGFLFTNVAKSEYNVFYTLIKTVGLIIIWSVCNWLICSLFSGKGTFSEVYVATAYSLIPFITYTVLSTVLSNFLPLSFSGIFNGLQIAIWIYTFFLLCVGMIIVHEYDFFKFIGTSIVVIVMMILLVFVIFMVAILIAQFWEFIVSVYSEAIYR